MTNGRGKIISGGARGNGTEIRIPGFPIVLAKMHIDASKVRVRW
jgi:hypothetical protein